MTKRAGETDEDYIGRVAPDLLEHFYDSVVEWEDNYLLECYDWIKTEVLKQHPELDPRKDEDEIRNLVEEEASSDLKYDVEKYLNRILKAVSDMEYLHVRYDQLYEDLERRNRVVESIVDIMETRFGPTAVESQYFHQNDLLCPDPHPVEFFRGRLSRDGEYYNEITEDDVCDILGYDDIRPTITVETAGGSWVGATLKVAFNRRMPVVSAALDFPRWLTLDHEVGEIAGSPVSVAKRIVGHAERVGKAYLLYQSLSQLIEGHNSSNVIVFDSVTFEPRIAMAADARSAA